MRKVPLVTDHYYHIFNRGVARQPIFFSKRDYQQFIMSLKHYIYIQPPMRLSRFKAQSIEQKAIQQNNMKHSKKKIEILAYVLMPNHFHLLLQQKADTGISSFLSQITNSYTKYINTKYDRVGPLFQGTFKTVHIETVEQLLHLSRYIHLNPIVSAVTPEKDFLNYPWSSFHDYLKGTDEFVFSRIIMQHFTNVQNYKEFVMDRISYAKELKNINHLVID